MSDENKNTNDDQAGNNLEIVHKGHKLSVTMERAIELAQKGMNYEHKMAQVKEERAALSKDAEQFAAYEQLKAHLQAHPEHAQAWQRIVAGEKVHFEGDGPPPRNGQRPQQGQAQTSAAPDAERLVRLEAELENMRSVMQGQMAADQQTSMRQRMDAEMAQYPHVRGKAEDAVKVMAMQYMQANPDEGVEAAVAVAASQFGAAIQDAQKAELDRSRESQSQRIGRGRDGGLPALTEGETPTMEDLNSGKLRDKAANIFASFKLDS